VLDSYTQDTTQSLLSNAGDGVGAVLGPNGLFESLFIAQTSQNALLKDSAVEKAVSDAENVKQFKVVNEVARVPLLDDSYWRSIVVNSINDTVCSYELVNSNTAASNVFEI